MTTIPRDAFRKQECDGCKFWSELLCAVGVGGSTPLKAMCLNQESPEYQKYVYRGCQHYTPGRAIDDPSPVEEYNYGRDALLDAEWQRGE